MKHFGFYTRRILLIFIDFVLVIFGCILTEFMLSSMGVMSMDFHVVIKYSVLMAALVVTSLCVSGMYKNIWRYAGFIEILECAVVVCAVWLVSHVVIYIAGGFRYISEFYTIFAMEFSVLFIILSRSVYRVLYLRLKKPNVTGNRFNTLVVGAGFAGNAIITEMNRSDSEYMPVAIVDDDVNKVGGFIHGVKVVGTTKNIPKVVQTYQIRKIVVAMPSCNSKRRKEILNICSATSCDVRVLPYIHKLVSGETFLNQAKEINIEDLLGRDPVKFDQDKNRELIQGKICLITGGGGSIGSELSRQIAVNNPKQLIIVDIYENNAYSIQQELLRQYGDKLDLKVRIASVRDYNKMDALFEEFKPEIVFHAAAHKHVPLMEDSPAEAVKNNVFGTYNIAKLSEKYNVQKFVLVSTDKAVNPTNVMGATKRLCEMIIECMKQTSESATEFVAVRFGNVLGSNGSVIPLFKEQIKNGGPVTVTHPDVIRFFMTIPEATSLILQAASFAHGGEIFVLDMGEPVKILNLAENVIKLSGKKPYEEIKIEFVGLRPGEKLYEELLMNEEGLTKTVNQKIFIGKQTELDAEKFFAALEELRTISMSNDNEKCIEFLECIVPTFKRKSEKVPVM